MTKKASRLQIHVQRNGGVLRTPESSSAGWHPANEARSETPRECRTGDRLCGATLSWPSRYALSGEYAGAALPDETLTRPIVTSNDSQLFFLHGTTTADIWLMRFGEGRGDGISSKLKVRHDGQHLLVHCECPRCGTGIGRSSPTMHSVSSDRSRGLIIRFFPKPFAVGIWRVSMDLALFTDQLTLTQSERRRVTGVEEDESTGPFATLVRPSALRPSLGRRSEEGTLDALPRFPR